MHQQVTSKQVNWGVTFFNRITMRSLIVGLVAFFAMAGSASAGLIELDFEVDNLRAEGGAPVSYLTPFNYKIVLDSSRVRPAYQSMSYDTIKRGFWFSQPGITESTMSGDVLAHAADYGLKFVSSAWLDQSPPGQYGDGSIWETIGFRVNGFSPSAVDPLNPNNMITRGHYLRGIEKQGGFSGNSIADFPLDANGFIEFMRTLIGDDTFRFTDVSWFLNDDPVAGTGTQALTYGYFGQATLTSVTAFPGSNNSVNAVPEPSSFALLFLGLLLIVSTRWKRIVSRLKVHIFRSAAMTTRQPGSQVGARMTTI